MGGDGMKPLCIDLFCGLGGWAEGFLAEGYDVIGFDIERHDYGTGGYPGQLVLQDALTLDGRQFRNAACIVASPPCQEYSYMAMPWSLAKAKAAAIRADDTGEARRKLTALFDCCFRIQREASEAARRHIPMVVENVKGAQPWVGRAQANYGSFYLWGDVRSVGGRIIAAHRVEFGAPAVKACRGVAKVCGDLNWGRKGGKPSLGFNTTADAQVHGRKVPGMNFHEREQTGKPGRSFQSAAVDGVKQAGMSGPVWFDEGAAALSSKSTARKAASAQIAKIPFDLAVHIARCFKPSKEAAA